jgi:flagellar basal-body rod protein FlgG
MWSSANGMIAQQTNIDVISNNLANVNTPGYKNSDALFSDMVYNTEKVPGAKLSDGSSTPVGVEIGYGSKLVATDKSFDQGDMVNTGNQLDVAIQGKGFYEVDMPDGTKAYTRDGSFKLNANGQIVTNQGYKVTGLSQVDPNATDIAISADGSMSMLLNGQVQQLSPITLSNFPNPAGLKSIGDNLFVATDGSGAATTGLTPGQTGTGTLAQGFLEASNVQVVKEMVEMIKAQRAYEINSKAIQTADQMLSIANNLKQG